MLKACIGKMLPIKIKWYLKRLFAHWVMKKWRLTGCPVPPPHVVKQNTIREYQSRHNCQILIETGTYLGEMIEAQRKHFKRIYSVELSPVLYKNAVRRFRRHTNVTVLFGDSGKVLYDLIKEIDQEAVFWLDGHYSAGETAQGDRECPVLEELKAIFESRRRDHIILIDDARYFDGTSDFPSIAELTGFIEKLNQPYQLIIENDIIRLTPY